MKTATIKEQAEKLIRNYGDAAYHKAQETVRAARRHRNSRLERYWAKVAREVARRTSVATLDTMHQILAPSTRVPCSARKKAARPLFPDQQRRSVPGPARKRCLPAA